jgi:cellulose synthase/poly-beta-1,6-N-acetylglucosamine synthase-like glycosyltransferase
MYLDVGSRKKDEGKASKFPSIAIIIPTIHEGKFLKKCVNSALKLDYPRSRYTIYIALNKSSTKETVETATAIIDKNVKVIHCPMNGKASVMNYTIKNFVNEELLMVLDADTLIDRKAVRYLVPLFKKKNVGCAVSSVQVLKPTTIAEKLQKYEYLLSILSRKSLSSMMALMVAHGAGTMFRTKIIKKLGGFDENNNPTEDLEIGLRILTNGYQIETTSKAVSYTVVPPSFIKLFEQRKRWSSGFFFNILKYRKTLFNRANAKLGFFVVPLLLFSTILGVVFFVLTFYSVLYPFGLFLSNEYQFVSNTNINFVISSQLNNLIFNMNAGKIFTIVTTAIGLFSIYYALKYSGVKLNRVKDAIGIVGYIFFYIFFLSFVWLYTGIAFLINRRGFAWKIAT